MSNLSLNEFYTSGYLQVMTQGSQIVAKSIQGRKTSLVFTCKFILHYDLVDSLQAVLLSLLS